MEEKKVVVRPVLTEAQMNLVILTLSSMFPDNLAVHPEEMEIAAEVFRVAAELCVKSADIHRNMQIPWNYMCYAAMLPSSGKEMIKTQDSLEKMLALLHVDVIRQNKPGRGTALPNFMVAEK